LKYLAVPIVLRLLFGPLRIIGVTGGIATGKSTFTRYLKEKYNASVIDFDQIAKDVVGISMPAYEAIRRTFGNGVLHAEGTVNREALSNVCFSNPSELRKLNAIMTWPITKRFLWELFRRLFVERCGVVILDAPLLFERHLQRICTQTTVIALPANVHQERLMRRDNIIEPVAAQKIDAQWPLSKKIQLADIVIDNSGSVIELHSATDQWWSRIHSNRFDLRTNLSLLTVLSSMSTAMLIWMIFRMFSWT